jgi:hypothetical protein
MVDVRKVIDSFVGMVVGKVTSIVEGMTVGSITGVSGEVGSTIGTSVVIPPHAVMITVNRKRDSVSFFILFFSRVGTTRLCLHYF